MTEEIKSDQPEGNEADKGSEFIDFKTATPEEVEDRFKRIYGHMKEYERAFNTLAGHNKKLAERLDQFDADSKRVSVVTETERLKARIQQARDNGNHAEADEMLAKLAGLQTQRIQAPQAAAVVEAPSFDVSVVTIWQNEVDGDGNFRRPWAQPSHPKFQESLQLTKDLMPRLDGDVEGLLREVDSKMGLKTKKGTGQMVLSGGEGRRVPKESGQLTPEEKAVAVKLGITAEQYLKQRRLIRGEAA